VSEAVAVKAGATRAYFRRDQRDGVCPPDLSKVCTYAEHIVHARGKRTQFTSVSLNLAKIKDFGDTDYRLNRERAEGDAHGVVEHEALLSELQRVAVPKQRPSVSGQYRPLDMPASGWKGWLGGISVRTELTERI